MSFEPLNSWVFECVLFFNLCSVHYLCRLSHHPDQSQYFKLLVIFFSLLASHVSFLDVFITYPTYVKHTLIQIKCSVHPAI